MNSIILSICKDQENFQIIHQEDIAQRQKRQKYCRCLTLIPRLAIAGIKTKAMWIMLDAAVIVYRGMKKSLNVPCHTKEAGYLYL